MPGIAPGESPPPLYKPELIEPKKKLTLLQRCYKEPWVPIGCGTTVAVLSVGLGAFVSGNKVLAQHMMRARVAAQFATIGARSSTCTHVLHSMFGPALADRSCSCAQLQWLSLLADLPCQVRCRNSLATWWHGWHGEGQLIVWLLPGV